MEVNVITVSTTSLNSNRVQEKVPPSASGCAPRAGPKQQNRREERQKGTDRQQVLPDAARRGGAKVERRRRVAEVDDQHGDAALGNRGALGGRGAVGVHLPP